MKKSIKILCGFVLAASMCVPVFAENIPVLFNQVRIHCVDYGNVTSWGKNIDEKNNMPSSILYNDTTYVPLRWISKNMEKNVVWNDDSKTVGILNNIIWRQEVVTKADLNGNEWTYRILFDKDGFSYLSVLDEKRNYERCYRLASENAYKVEDDAIWFVANGKYGNSTVFRLPFLNDENSQDGERIVSIGNASNVKFDKDYMFFVRQIRRGTTNPHDELGVIYLKTGECKGYYAGSVYIENLFLKSSNEDEAVLSFKIKDATWHMPRGSYEITVNKKDMSFGDKKNTTQLQRDKKPVIQKEGPSLKDFSFLNQGMAMEEIYKTVGEPTENEAEWRIYELNNSNKLYLKENADVLEEVWIKAADGVKIKIKFNQDGKVQIS